MPPRRRRRRAGARRARDPRADRWPSRERARRCRPAARAPRSARGAGERGEGRPSRLVGQRDVHLSPCGERLDQPPLRSGQILEAVGEDRGPAPRAQLRSQPLDGGTAHDAAIVRPEPSQLRAVGQRQSGQIGAEIGGLEQPRLDLRQRARERIGEPGEAGRRPELAQVGRRDDPADEEPCARRHRGSAPAGCCRRGRRTACRTCRPCPPAALRHARRARARRGRRRPGSERSARDRDPALRRTGRAGARPCRRAPVRRRARDPSAHRSPGLTAGFLMCPELAAKSEKRNRARSSYAADFGLRPRRATALPGMVPAQPSHRSAALAPRRASVNVTRRAAPRPSSTSEPQLSQTRIVFLAMSIPFRRDPTDTPRLARKPIGN